MAVMNKIETIAKLIEAYGAAARSGLITPCLQDENEFRAMMRLKPAPEIVEASWTAQGGTRAPVTLQRAKDIEESQPTNASPAEPVKEEDE